MNTGIIKTEEGATVQFEVSGRTAIITVRDDEGMKGFCLTIEETIDLCNALQKKVITALYAKDDGI
jgi:hypothetical protein